MLIALELAEPGDKAYLGLLLAQILSPGLTH